MNILFAYPSPFHPNRGGIERVTDLLAREFIRRNHKVFYIHNKTGSKEIMQYPYPAELFFFPDKYVFSKRNHQYYRQFLSDRKIDIVINQLALFEESRLYCDTEGTPAKSISVIHSNPLLNYEHLWYELSLLRNHTLVEYFKWIARLLLYTKIKADYFRRLQSHYTWLVAHTDAICLLSEAWMTQLLQMIPGNHLKVFSIPNPVNIPKKNAGYSKKENIVLFVGRLQMKDKRPDRMLKIWEKITPRFPSWKLLILGDGPDKPRLEHQARKLPRVSFKGFVDPEEYYSSASILCLTSSYEGWGMVLSESMSHGCIPIAFESFASLNEIVPDSRQKVTPFSINEFVEKLTLIMESAQLRETLSRRQIQHVVQFSVTKVADLWEEKMEEVVHVH